MSLQIEKDLLSVDFEKKFMAGSRGKMKLSKFNKI